MASGGAAHPKFAVLGAGISGLCAAQKIKREFPNAELVVFESLPQLGGTWYVNTYPGAACDIMSHFYSLCFELNPSWSQAWSSQGEIHAYLVHAATKHGLTRHIRFNSRVEEGRWNAATKMWDLRVKDTAGGGTHVFSANFLFAGPGALCEPSAPSIPGLDAFTGGGGALFHSARWDHSVSLEGKTVAVVGTGASAAQIAPAIVDKVAHMYLLQRTPAWVMPRGNYAYSALAKWLFATLPFLISLYRTCLWYMHDVRFFAFIHPQPVLKGVAVGMARAHLESEVADPALRAALTPHYPLGCKRVVVSDDFYRALTRPNAALIPSALQRFTKTGIVCADGRAVSVDAVVLATGFDVAKSFPGIPFFGEGGYSLAKKWAQDGPEAYYGVLAPSMPNLFFLVGPNTGLGHSSIIAMIDCQVHYAVECIKGLRAGGAATVQVRQDASDTYNARIQTRLANRVWTGCASWYNGQGTKNVTLWPDTVTQYWWSTRTPDWKDLIVG